jgi:hypothetical protein
MELIHIANATFSSLRIKNHSLENLASKTKTFRIVKEHTSRKGSRNQQNLAQTNEPEKSSAHCALMCVDGVS